MYTEKHFTVYMVGMTVAFGFVTTYLMLCTKLYHYAYQQCLSLK